MALKNAQVADHVFLKGMYADGYYPDHVVDKGAAILRNLCERIEATRPAELAALYALTHAATEEFNDLEEEFAAAGSEIETVARDLISLPAATSGSSPPPTASRTRTSRN